MTSSTKYMWRRRAAIALAVAAVAGGGWLVVRGDGSSSSPTDRQAAVSAEASDKMSKPERRLTRAFEDALAWRATGKSLTKWQPPADVAAASSRDYIVVVTLVKGTCYTLGNAPGYDGSSVKADPSGIRCQQTTLESLARSMAAYEDTKPVS